MLKFGPFSGHFDYLARIRVLARNFGSTGSSAKVIPRVLLVDPRVDYKAILCY